MLFRPANVEHLPAATDAKMTVPVITCTGLRLRAPEDPPTRDELDHPDFLKADGSRDWELWSAPEGWECDFARHLSTDLLYHPDDRYLIGWWYAEEQHVDLFDCPSDGNDEDYDSDA